MSGGLSRVLSWQAIAAVGSAILLIVCLRTPQLKVADANADSPRPSILGDRFMWLLAGLVFVGMGTYNAIATWLQPILDRVGEGYAAGNVIALMTGAGIVGAATLAPVVAARNRRKTFLLASLVLSVITFGALAARHEVWWFAIWLTADGLFLMASLPVVLDWSEEHAGPNRQAMATGLLLMAGNVGGLIIPGVMQLLLNSSSLPLLLLACVALLGLPLALRLPNRADKARRV
jgi:predicted MFS family arabinose efflux permease